MDKLNYPNLVGLLESNRNLRMHEVERLVGLKRCSIYVRIREGRFPPGHLLSARARRWPAGEIATWLNKQSGAAA